MLRFLKLRAIIDNRDIYPLSNKKRIIIPVEKNNFALVITDGFHITRPLQLSYDQPGYFNFEVTCIVDDLALLGGAFILIVFYLLGLFTGFLLLKLLSFLPVISLLFFYYVNRRNFLKLNRIYGKYS